MILWHYDTLTPGLLELQVRGEANLEDVLEKFAEKAKQYMKDNAPWNDNTGAARDGLDAETFEQGDAKGVILYHTVDYGLWLEVRWDGRYAIIMPTIEALGGELMQDMHGILDLQGIGLEFE